MKTIGLIQIDGSLPNLALMKLSAWHKKQGDRVIVMRGAEASSRLVEFDKVYISCIFDVNREKALSVASQFKNVEIGGIGVNGDKLPKKIEHIMPDYGAFNCDYSLGFTTRGCIRKCYFCKVPEHEGMIKKNCDIYEFWEKEHNQIVLLDNNILALPKHFMKIARQLKDNNLHVDFNQGLDHRLLTPKLCTMLLELKHIAEIRFAFDDIGYTPSVLAAIDMLKKAGLKNWRARWYLYVGEKDTFQTVYERMRILREHKQMCYVMRSEEVYNKPEFIALAKYGNLMGAFKYSLNELLEKSTEMRRYKPILDRYINMDGDYSPLTDKPSAQTNLNREEDNDEH